MIFIPGPGGIGSGSGAGGRADTFSFLDLMDYGELLYDTFEGFTDWLASPLSEHLGDGVVSDLVSSVLPDFFSQTTGYELLLGSTLGTILVLSFVRWARGVFL